ncbi:MAG: hypothetical protein LPK19_05605 [Hymenobacteraceae bacterium]|nr:hypothetical protein [Hymenobacteraceae bacterium]MDX5395677.1 hypothetical protein [Hymenobacteraceae bacterium]MDX5511730.1 hypothetical protein [Hymenobacteraceae bacterium]
MKKRYLIIGDFKRNALVVAAAAALGFSSCSSDSETNNQTEWQADQGPVEGVLTELTEVEPDTWKITGEQVVAPSATAAVLKYQDGRIDTLKGLELEQKMQTYAQANPSNHSGNGMMNVLMWSGLGYMAGRYMSPNPAYYANPGLVQQNSAWRSRYRQEEELRGSGRGGYFYGGNYRNPEVNTPSRTRSTTAPKSGRSGFFRGRSSGFPS